MFSGTRFEQLPEFLGIHGEAALFYFVGKQALASQQLSQSLQVKGLAGQDFIGPGKWGGSVGIAAQVDHLGIKFPGAQVTAQWIEQVRPYHRRVRVVGVGPWRGDLYGFATGIFELVVAGQNGRPALGGGQGAEVEHALAALPSG